MKTIKEWQEEIAGWGKRKGWTFEESELPTKLLLVISEVTEAFEEVRAGVNVKDVYFSEGEKPEGVGIELADAAIRLLHLCEGLGLDLDALIETKMAYNEKRSYRHGGKIA